MVLSTRRGFLVGGSAALAGIAGSRLPSFAFSPPKLSATDEVLVVLFLRGGMDGLSLLPPVSGPDRAYYEALRPNLQVPTSGSAAAIPLGTSGFGLHPAAAPLMPLWQDGRLAIVQASGMDENERSHFDSQDWIELGTPGLSGTTTGWLTRHLASVPGLPPELVVPSLSVADTQAVSLLGSYDTLNVASPDSFSLIGPWQWLDAQRTSLRALYGAEADWLHQAGLQALDAVDIVELYLSGPYTPSGGAVYPDTWLGQQLQLIARTIKMDLGLRVATLDLGGWDTHEYQGDGGEGFFAQLAGELAQGLAALYIDLDAGPVYTSRFTLVAMSEFGRRAEENADRGTDHGHGGPMLILSGNAIGGLHGSWPGLRPDQLADGDLAVTTDFRRVLSEILVRRCGNPNWNEVFPGYSGYAPLGVVYGSDLEPIFADGFESGDTTLWSQTMP